ncbi:tetratricopeptide repeat protein [Oceanospirillum beijerinckii]|uniref:tetratricopeptide repeat protein n=1 Tax=Oceanospirillum beijerinckii TaxID=64976 RepID=UPI0004231110|nr:tetratricopeptide repeat protein [Oceanospirillum beijerinckii]
MPQPSALIKAAVDERQQGNVKKSIQILHSGLQLHPGNLRIKLELASSYFANEEYDYARKLAQEVAVHEDIPDVVRNNIKQFLALIAQRQPEGKSKSLSRQNINVFSGYDSNANIAPADQSIDIGELTKDSVQKNDSFYGLQYDFARFTPVTLKQPQQGESLFYHAGVSLYFKDYLDVDGSDIYFINARSGAKYNFSKQWSLQGRVAMTHIGLDKQKLVNYYDLSSMLDYRFDRSNLSLNLEANFKDYYDSDDRDKNGYHLSPSVSYKFMLPKQVIIRLKAGHTAANLKSTVHSYTASEYGLNISVPFTLFEEQRFIVELGTGKTSSYYRGIETHYRDKRQDTTYKHSLKLNALNIYQQLNMELSYNWYKRHSNHDIHEYQRELVTLSFKYPFGS